MRISQSPNKIQIKVYKILTKNQLLTYLGVAIISFIFIFILQIIGVIISIILVILSTLYLFKIDELKLYHYITIRIKKYSKKIIYLR